MSKKILVINEKRDQSVKLADAMGWTQGSFCFTGTFNGKEVECVWASGHLHTLISPDVLDKTLRWTDEPTKLLPIPRDFKLQLIDNSHLPKPIQASVLYGNITKRLKYVDEIIIATDADREGEAIARNIISQSGFKGTVRRAWLAAGLDKKSLTSAMANLKGEFDTIGWFRSAEARGRSDWAYQYLVRAYTFYANYGKFGMYLGQGNGAEGIMSVGRLQTVIVSMIVNREKEIKEFKPKDYFSLSADFNFQDTTFGANYSPRVTETMISDNPVGVTWEPQKPKNGNPQLDKPLFTDRGVVESYKNALMSKASETYIHSYNETNEKEGAPNPFSLTDAQKIIGKACGTSATVTQVILEDLYEQGWTSYARTSKSELPINLYDPAERNDILAHLKNIPSLSSQASFAMDLHDGKISEHKPFVPKSFVRKDMEHYGIIPTKQVMTTSSFSSLAPKKKKNGKMLHTAANMQKAYEMIAQRYIQMFYPPAEYGVQSVQINVPVRDILGNDESVFKTRGKRLISEGWKAAFPTRTKAADSTLPKMTKDEVGQLKQVNSKKGRTRPPARYNAISLPKELEMVGKDVADPKLRKLLQNAEGIGMPATRSTAIETVLARKYAITKNEDFYATNKGADLIRFVPKWLSTPETSAIWEEYLKKIESQKDDAVAIEMRDNFVNKQLERIEELITYMNNKFLGSLGDKIKPPPKKVSQKMKDLIKKLETQKNIKSPRGTLSDPLMAQAFIREHIQSGPKSSSDSYTPSEKQIALAKSIVKYLPNDFEVDESMYSDGKKLSDFISKNKKYSPPTAGQLKYLESIIAKLPAGTFVPEDARKYASECSAFINKHKKG